MKTKASMLALSLLLVLALVGAMLVPAVSADVEVSYDPTDLSQENRKYLTPEEMKNAPVHEPKIYNLRSLADAKTSPELNNRQIEFVYSVFNEADILDATKGESGNLISVTIPKTSVAFISQQAGQASGIPEITITESPQTEGTIFVLWAPKELIKTSETGDRIYLEFPKELLMEYKDLESAKKSIAESKEENLQIESDTVPSLESSLIAKNVKASDFQERSWYYDSNCADQINGVTGKIYPSGSYNLGESYCSYHEMEIYLSSPPDYIETPDLVEFVSYHRTDDQKRAFIVVYDERISYTVKDIDATSVSYLEYYFYIENSGGWVYWMHFRNPATGTWYTASWDDSDDPSYYVRDIRGSTELMSLQHVPPIYSFQTVTSPIQVDWTRTTSDWFTPSQTVSWEGYTPNEQYVNHQASWNGNGGIDTSHYCGSGVA